MAFYNFKPFEGGNVNDLVYSFKVCVEGNLHMTVSTHQEAGVTDGFQDT